MNIYFLSSQRGVIQSRETIAKRIETRKSKGYSSWNKGLRKNDLNPDPRILKNYAARNKNINNHNELR